MKINVKYAFGVLLSILCLECTPRNSLPIPGLGSYFTFADKNKTALLKRYDLIAERVDPADTTKILYSQKLSNRFFVELHSSRIYTLIFALDSDAMFQPGLNKLNRVRFRYDGLPGVVDWLEYTNTAEEWINPANVKFNGKPVQRIDSNEPVERSFLYVLE